MENNANDIHLSVVAVSRNDNHGGSLTYRMQHFVSGFIEQCKRHDLKAELILVEWNPPEDNPPLVETLKFPHDLGPCCVRIICVPNELHMKLKHSNKQPLYQMIGKNVGIQRARGKYVLATNIDIIFSDEIIKFMKNRLRPGKLYRVDRLDVPADLPENVSFENLLNFCKKNYFRINGKYGTYEVSAFIRKLGLKFLCKSLSLVMLQRGIKNAKLFITNRFLPRLVKIPVVLSSIFLNVIFSPIMKINRYDYKYALSKLNNVFKSIPVSISMLKKVVRKSWTIFAGSLGSKNCLHTNACGDFTLLSLEDWKNLRGYPEWDMYSWHLDSVFLYQARYSGIMEVDLPFKYSIYHIEHGGGYTPEESQTLFSRLDRRGIPYLTNADLGRMVDEMKNKCEPILYNGESWSYLEEELSEVILNK